MAKKKTEVDYTEVHETPIENLVGEEDKVAEEEIKAEETPKEEVTEVEFDPEKFKQEISEETAKKIIEATTKREEPTKEVDEELMSPWAKEGRNPKDYEEVADWGITKKSILDKRDSEVKEKETEEQTKKQEDEKKQQIESFNKYTDEQLEDLMNAGKLPRPVDPKNEGDEGIIARKALFQKMLEVNHERTKAGKTPIYSVKEIFYEHYTAPTAQPAGADAPVSFGKGNVPSDGKEIDYVKDVKSKSLMDILMGK